MLTEIHIENFAIIERLDLQFLPGLVTFTGETGAGKSIIIDAVEILLGGKAEINQVRAGSERASVEGIFRIPETVRAQVHAILAEQELLDEPDFLTLGREIRSNGRSVARINGRSVSASLLRQLGEHLVDVHGQSEHLSLLHVNQHLGLLDRYAAVDSRSDLQNQLKAYQQTYQRLQQIGHELEKLRQDERDAARRSDMLAYQIKEIEAAHLRPGEEEELRGERNRLANAEGLASLTQEALLALDEGSPEAAAASDLFGQAAHALASLERLDPSQAALSEQAQSLLDGLSELIRNLRLYLESIEFNPRRLDQVEERLGILHNLKRKYGDSIPVVLEFAAAAKRQLDEITHASERIQELEAEQERLLVQLGQEGQALSQTRQAAAQTLETAIEAELDELHMSGAHFKVDFHRQPDLLGAPMPDGQRLAYHANGIERVEFLIAPNPGEGFKPLAKIASGGETSRLMLALKNVLAQADHIATLIFDEIDQGIGGRVGAIVGHKLWRLGRQHQVLCITHLPQLAAFGEQHFHVAKQVQSNRTTTQVSQLEGQERLMELAQMLGSLSDGTLQSARELLHIAEQQTAAPGAQKS
ncbi:MAG: DNA repair protein RecN [Anaerolineales bacterium]|nr:DNA repair protein RecN [Anaerolineales bacterium]